MGEWLGHWTCNLMVPGSSPPPCYSLDLFAVSLSSTHQLGCVISQLVCFLPVGILKHFVYLKNLVLCTHIGICKWVYMHIN